MPSCKIVIRDEVNIKFDNLPVDVRRKISNKLKFELPYARHMPQYKLGRWDGTTTFFGIGGNGYLNHLEVIIPILDDNNIDITEIEDLRLPHKFEFEPVSSTFWADRGKVWPVGHMLAGQPLVIRDDQVDSINKCLNNLQSIHELATGYGKCQPLSSHVLTSNGWQTMKDINPGDMVITPAGMPATVLSTFHPGVKDIYEITFEDGRTARCCEDHVWPIYNIGWGRSKTGPWRNLTTKEIIKLKTSTNRAIGIPLVSMEHDNEDISLPMDPWLLGFLLGDGSFRNGHISFSTSDIELLDKVRSKLDPEYRLKQVGRHDYSICFASRSLSNLFRKQHLTGTKKGISTNNYTNSFDKYQKIILDLGLGETSSSDKFVPEIYFDGSKHQRLELIRGLIDSDGLINKSSVTLTTTSKQLAKDFQRLIWSVGGIAKISYSSNRAYLYNGIRKSCKDAYTVATRYKTPWELTSLTRKVNNTGMYYQYGPTLKLRITDIKKIGSDEVKCIYIDDPAHLYITNDYVVTHNTILTSTLSAVCEPYGRTLIIVPNKNLVVQTEEDYRNVGLDVGVYYGDRKETGKTHTIITWQSLNALDKKRLDSDALTLAEFLNGITTVIVDEAHNSKGNVLHNLLTKNLANAPIRWGLTGTVPKLDIEYNYLLSAIGPVANRVAANELQDAGILSNCNINVKQLIDFKEFKTYAEENHYLTTDNERMKFVASVCEEISKTGNTLILVNKIESGNLLNSYIPDSVFLSGKDKLKVRKDQYDEMKDTNDKVLIATYGIAAVGLNINRIFNLILVEPGKSFVRVIQSIGRGLRIASDKNHVEIYDIASTCKFSKRHLTERKKYYKDAQYAFNITKIDWNK